MKIILNSFLLLEGIDIDRVEKTVAYNPKHEDNVSTSQLTNPTVDYPEMLDGVLVWSVFKRKSGSPQDGNPLLYAMKDEDGWKFKSKYDEERIYDQLRSILRKYFKTYSSDVTILVPSTNSLNKKFLAIVTTFNKDSEIINDLFRKATVDDVWNDAIDFNSKFREKFFTKKMFNDALDQLEDDMERMGEFFKLHLVKNPDIRSCVKEVIKMNQPKVAKYIDAINGKNILILDDNVSGYKTTQNICQSLKLFYKPKSITILTLFSKKYDEKKAAN